MKKFVTFLMVGYCMLCSSDLFSSDKHYPNSSIYYPVEYNYSENEYSDCNSTDFNESINDIAVGDCGSINGISFYGSSGCTSVGSVGCIEVTASDFNNILAFQWSVAYDSTVIQLDTAFDVSLTAGSFRWGRRSWLNGAPGTNIGNPTQNILGSNFQFPSGTNKVITISWLQPSFAGISTSDCDVLFEMCFDAVGNNGSSSPVLFTANPTNVEVADVNGNVLLSDVGSFSNCDFSVAADCNAVTPPTTTPPTTPTDDCGTINGISFYNSTGCASAGGNGCVEVTASDFNNILSFQWSMAFDSTVIQLDTAMEVGLNPGSFRWGRRSWLAGAAGTNIGNPTAAILGSNFQFPSGTNKVITVSWLEPNFGGRTVPECEVLFELCFNALGSNGQSSPVVFSANPTNVEVANISGNVLLNNADSFVDNTFTIQTDCNAVTPPTTTPPTTPTDDCGTINGISFYNSTGCASAGDNGCVEVTASDFNNILSFQWSMAFDSTVIQLDTAMEVGLNPGSFRWGRRSWLSGAAGTNIGNPTAAILGSNFQFPSGTNKVITVSWLEPNFGGRTVPECEVLFELCFNAVGSNGQSSPVVFSANPTTVEVANVSGNVLLNNADSFADNTFTIQADCNGVTPPNPPNPPTPTDPDNCGTLNGISFYSSNGCGDVNEDICVDITAVDFNNVLSFQWSMAFDSTVIQLDTVMDINLTPGSFRWGRRSWLSGAAGTNVGNPTAAILGSNFQFPSGTNKLITVSWLQPNFAGVTLPDCEPLFQMCFNAVGNVGETSPIVFTNSPTVVEVADVNGNVLLSNINSFLGSEASINNNCAGTVDPLPTPSNVNITNVGCRGDNSGAISLTFNESTAGLTFNWNPGSFNTMNISGVSAGNYTLQIFDGTRDTSLNYIITEPANSLSANTSNISQISCNGSNNGAISIQATGGTGNISYSWNSGLPPVANQNDLSPGAYTVTVMDVNGCQEIVGPIAISEPTDIQIIGNETDVDCFGRSNGRINLSVSGGTPGNGGYSYNWNTGASTQNLTNIPAGNYTVTVTDGNGCQAMDAFTVGSAAPIVITANSIIGEVNGNDGSIDISVTGGTLNAALPDYIYVWSPSANVQLTQDAVNLPAGTHTVTVTDATGCTATATFTVNFVGPAFSVDNVIVTESCPDTNNGSIEVQFTGGTSPQITWTNFAGPNPPPNFTITGLAIGNYQYVITDNGIQVGSNTVLVGVRPPLNITGQVTPETNGSDGSVVLNPIGNSTGTLTYAWSNIAVGGTIGTGASLTGLRAGTYQVSVTDSGAQGTGCSNTARFVIEDRRPVVVDGFTAMSPNCAEDGTGSVEFTISQGLPNFTIEITGAGIQPITQNRNITAPFNFIENGLPEGDYVVTITDGNMSVFTENFTIVIPDPLTASGTIIPSTDTQNGRINLDINGGTPGYNQDWGPGINPANLQPGTYRATVTDANGCEFITNDFSVTRFRIIEFNRQDATCMGAADGSISVSPDGGNLPYQYRWIDNSNGTVIGNDPAISGLEPGSYTVIVTGASGIEITQTYTIDQQSSIAASTNVTSNFSGFNVSCFGENDGQARVVPTDGISPYTFRWDDGQTTDQAFNLPAGTINITVEDAVGCMVVSSVTLTQPSAIQISQDITGIDCFGDANGEIFIDASGGVRFTGVDGYIYQWAEPTFEGRRVRNVTAGDYDLLIEDANGCQRDLVVTVGGPTEELFALVEATSSEGDCTGSARAEVIGGTPPYSYRWINRFQSDSTNRELLGLCANDYTVEITDANGCQVFATGRVNNTAIECLSTRAVMTPDGGGLNEEFIIWCIEQFPDNTLEIYNRWGQLVWEQDEYDNTWRGRTMRGGDVPDGAYFYVFRYVRNGETLQTKGSFTLLRE